MADSIDWETVSAAITSWVRSGSGLDQQHVFWAYEGKKRPSAPYIELSLQQVRSVGYDWHNYEDNPYQFPTQTVSAVSTGSDTLTVTGHPFGNGDGPIHIASSLTLPTPLQAGTDYWVIVVDANTIKLATSYVNTGGQQPLGAGNPVTPIDLTTTGSGVITIAYTSDTLKAGEEIVSRAQGFREVTVHMDCFVAEGQGYAAVVLLSDVIAALQLNLYALDQAGLGVSDLGQAFSQGGVTLVEGRRGSILEPRAMIDLVFYLASNLTGFETIISTVSAEVQVTREDGTTELPEIPLDIPPE